MSAFTNHQYKVVEKLLKPKIAPRIASMRLEVGVYDLIHETLLKGLKRGLNTISDSQWEMMAEDVLKDAYRKQKRAKQAEQGWVEGVEPPEDQLWERLDEALEGRSWEEKRLVRLLRAGHSLRESAEQCGLSPWQARKRLLKLRNTLFV